MKINFEKIFILLLLLLITLPIASAVELQMSRHTGVAINSMTETYSLIDENSEVNIDVALNINYNYETDDTLIFKFDPILFVNQKIKNDQVNFRFCQGYDCKLIPTEKYETHLTDIFLYGINITIPESEKNVAYTVQANYNIENFVVKKGDTQIIYLRTTCEVGLNCGHSESENIQKIVILPDGTVPIYMPEKSRLNIRTDGTWEIIMYGIDSQSTSPQVYEYIWFENEVDIKDNQTNLWLVAIISGIIISFISLLIAERKNLGPWLKNSVKGKDEFFTSKP